MFLGPEKTWMAPVYLFTIDVTATLLGSPNLLRIDDK